MVCAWSRAETKARNEPARLRRARLTVQARVVVVDGLHGATEVELDVPLDQAGVEGAQVTALVVDAGTKGQGGRRGITLRGWGGFFTARFPRLSPERGDFVLRQVLVALEAVFVSVEDGQALVRQHLRLLQLNEGERRPLTSGPASAAGSARSGRSLTASSGSPWKNLRSGSSRYCRQSTHLGGVVCKARGDGVGVFLDVR